MAKTAKNYDWKLSSEKNPNCLLLDDRFIWKSRLGSLYRRRLQVAEEALLYMHIG
jgi:hypothetical protein